MTQWIADSFKDLRYGLRIIRRNPLVSMTAIASLALGIGGATSVFTVLNAVVLRALPVPNPHQLYMARKATPNGESPRFSWPAFEQARAELKGRAELCAATGMFGMQVRPDGTDATVSADRVNVQLVSGECFEVLRQQPQAGRLLTPSDNRPGMSNPAAVISDAYWARQFNRSPEAIGRSVLINGTGFTIAGVAGPRFFGPFVAARNPDLWIPLMMQPAVRYAANASTSGDADPQKPWAAQASIEWLFVFARVGRTSDLPSIASAWTVLHQRDAVNRPQPGEADARARIAAERVVLTPAARGESSLRRNLQAPLVVLLAIVGVLVAIACGNLASLLLARASARDREIAIRLSIGASRPRLVRQLLTETLLLAAIGGGLGLMGAAWGRDALLAMLASTGAAIDLDTGFDVRVIGFVVGLTVLTGIVAGLMPALRGTRVPLSEAMKQNARAVGTGGSPRSALLGKALVAAQIAFCLVMLVVAALFIRSLRSLMTIDVGFDRAQVLVARLDVRSMGYSDAERQALYTRVADAVTRVPGVVSASLSMNGPLGTSTRTSSLAVEGYTPSANERIFTSEEIVTEDYFSTVGLRLLQGRLLGPDDRLPERRTTVINETMARRYFAGGSPIGKRWNYGGAIGPDAYVIVGVVEDAKYTELRGTPPNMAYRLAAAAPDEVLANMEIRTAMAPAQLAAAVRQALNGTVPDLPVFEVVPLEHRLTRGATIEKLVAQLSSVFGAVALLLASLGVYGTMSYGVTRRVSELAVRMALGAERRDVLWLVMRESLVLLATGALAGLVLAVLAGRGLATLLYGIPPLDPISYAGGAAVLTVVVGTAAWLPAYRASRIEPMAALRQE
jgi:predicted permease